MFSKVKKVGFLIVSLHIIFFVHNTITIHFYSYNYSEEKSDVAIVLGAKTSQGKLSPVFKERINHGIYLYQNKIVDKILFTGGFGKDETISESATAKKYALTQGVSETDILIEERSKYTFQNIIEAKKLMDSLQLKSALIVSDPYHMKRAMSFAEKENLNCKPSPTKTSMYKSFGPKLGSLLYESYYYSIGMLAGYN